MRGRELGIIQDSNLPAIARSLGIALLQKAINDDCGDLIEPRFNLGVALRE